MPVRRLAAGNCLHSLFAAFRLFKPATIASVSIHPLPDGTQVARLASGSGKAALNDRLGSNEAALRPQEDSFPAIRRSYATAGKPVTEGKQQIRKSASGYKQRTSPLAPRQPPDVSPDRFREIGEKSFQQMLARDTTAASPEQRQVVEIRGKRRFPQPQNKPAAPWTPTRLLQKRKVLTKRMGFLIQELEKEKEAEAMKQKSYPNFGPGSVLELTMAVPENKGKPATVKGLCIAKKNRGIRTSFTLLNHLGTFGQVERMFPLYSPSIKAIKVYEHRHVRRAKLYYLRDRNPREYRVN